MAGDPFEPELAGAAAQELARTYRQRLGHFYRQDLHELVPLPLIRGDKIVTPAELLNVLSTSPASPLGRVLR